MFEEECALAAAHSKGGELGGGDGARRIVRGELHVVLLERLAPAEGAFGGPRDAELRRSPRRDRHTPCTVSPSTAAAAASSIAAAASSSSGAHAGTLTRRPRTAPTT